MTLRDSLLVPLAAACAAGGALIAALGEQRFDRNIVRQLHRAPGHAGADRARRRADFRPDPRAAAHGGVAVLLHRDRIGLAQFLLDNSEHFLFQGALVRDLDFARLLCGLFGELDDRLDDRLEVPVKRSRQRPPARIADGASVAAAVARALEADAPAGIYNAADDTELLMGEWLDRVADHAGLPRPPRVSRSQIAALVPPETLSFMQESRRLDNTRLKRVLGVRLRHPTVHEGLRHEHAIGVH